MRRAKEIKPGGSAQVDILLEEKMHCYVGDKFVLRDQSLDLTLGGGEIVFAEKFAETTQLHKKGSDYREL